MDLWIFTGIPEFGIVFFYILLFFIAAFIMMTVCHVAEQIQIVIVAYLEYKQNKEKPK